MHARRDDALRERRRECEGRAGGAGRLAGAAQERVAGPVEAVRRRDDRTAAQARPLHEQRVRLVRHHGHHRVVRGPAAALFGHLLRLQHPGRVYARHRAARRHHRHEGRRLAVVLAHRLAQDAARQVLLVRELRLVADRRRPAARRAPHRRRAARVQELIQPRADETHRTLVHFLLFHWHFRRVFWKRRGKNRNEKFDM